MPMSFRKLPPLAMLRAFEAAARHVSFARAGAELGVTAAAISQQVRALEEHLGRSLFLRRAQGGRSSGPAHPGWPPTLGWLRVHAHRPEN